MTRASVFAALIVLLAACADNNPIEWGKSAARGIGDMFGGDTPPEAEPPAAEGRPYPNLATVPRRPRDPPEVKAQRQADVERLSRDRDAALAADQTLRDTGAMPPATSEPAPEAPRQPAAAASAPVTGIPPQRRSTPLAVQAPSPTVAVAPSPALVPAPASPAAAAPVGAPARRVGSVSFARDAASLTATAQRSLLEAASLARSGNDRVRLIPAQTASQAASVDLARARLNAITQALAAAGIPAARLTVDEALGRRVDLYDVYVER